MVVIRMSIFKKVSIIARDARKITVMHVQLRLMIKGEKKTKFKKSNKKLSQLIKIKICNRKRRRSQNKSWKRTMNKYI
jgi:hypothetical protein